MLPIVKSKIDSKRFLQSIDLIVISCCLFLLLLGNFLRNSFVSFISSFRLPFSHRTADGNPPLINITMFKGKKGKTKDDGKRQKKQQPLTLTTLFLNVRKQLTRKTKPFYRIFSIFTTLVLIFCFLTTNVIKKYLHFEVIRCSL